MTEDTNWILFAKRSSRDNCIGRGRILDCKVGDNSLYIDMTLDGVRFVGNLTDVLVEEVKQFCSALDEEE